MATIRLAQVNWYFTPNNTNAEFTDVHEPNTYYQDIAVDTGELQARPSLRVRDESICRRTCAGYRMTPILHMSESTIETVEGIYSDFEITDSILVRRTFGIEFRFLAISP